MNRSQARRRAVDFLFEAEQRSMNLRTLVEERKGSEAGVPSYCEHIVLGVDENRARIDEIISTYSQGWSIERMPAVDRALLRVGVWEILFNDDVPDAVAVSEAVDIAQELSTDDSPGFVNGLLGRILELKPGLMI